MDAELTNRSRDAINAATSRAVSEGHPDLTPAHLLLALLGGRTTRTSSICWPPSTPTRPPYGPPPSVSWPPCPA